MPTKDALERARPRRRRPFGVRLWLALMFAAIGILSGASVYLFVSSSSEQAAGERSNDVALGRTLRLAQRIGNQSAQDANSAIAKTRNESFSAWAFNADGELISPETVLGVPLDLVPGGSAAVRSALEGARVVEETDGDVTVVALPIFRNNRLSGAVLARATRPLEVRSALQALRGERLTALAIAVGVAALIGFAVATLISGRVKRLAEASAKIAQGRLDIPLEARGRDEIGDLGRAMDAMRIALRDTFDALSSERDRLSAIFDALTDAVIVVGRGGEARFHNPAAAPLISNGRTLERLDPWVRRAAHRGSAAHDSLRLGDRVWAIQARELPSEQAVLLFGRDRTEELRREVAEREFVSNAAHELRNPIAGMSGAIEVLRAGAKDDPEAREHFLDRLADDADRVSRLTQSLLTLARMEAVGEGEAEVVGVARAAAEAVEAVEVPEKIELEVEVDQELTAQADPVLLKQVLIGLLTNAFKNTPEGSVTVRARRRGDDQVLIEVADTGTGIEAGERERVFERFYRGSGSLEQEGFGLGLSIAKRMVDVMGGEIGVESELGRGTTFWIKLGAAAASPTPVA